MKPSDSPHAAGTPEHNAWVKNVLIPAQHVEKGGYSPDGEPGSANSQGRELIIGTSRDHRPDMVRCLLGDDNSHAPFRDDDATRELWAPLEREYLEARRERANRRIRDVAPAFGAVRDVAPAFGAVRDAMLHARNHMTVFHEEFTGLVDVRGPQGIMIRDDGLVSGYMPTVRAKSATVTMQNATVTMTPLNDDGTLLESERSRRFELLQQIELNLDES